MEQPLNGPKMGMDGGGGGGGFLEIDSDQQIYGDTFGAIPNNPFSGMGLPSLGGSGNTMILLIVAGLILAFILTRKKK
jgi:hypothetical protein